MHRWHPTSRTWILFSLQCLSDFRQDISRGGSTSKQGSEIRWGNRVNIHALSFPLEELSSGRSLQTESPRNSTDDKVIGKVKQPSLEENLRHNSFHLWRSTLSSSINTITHTLKGMFKISTLTMSCCSFHSLYLVLYHHSRWQHCKQCRNISDKN